MSTLDSVLKMNVKDVPDITYELKDLHISNSALTDTGYIPSSNGNAFEPYNNEGGHCNSLSTASGSQDMSSTFYSGSSLTTEVSEVETNGLDDESPALYKASSVPHLHSGSSKVPKQLQQGPIRRKKTTDASPLPDPVMLQNILQENQRLKETIMIEEEERKKIVSINHTWGEQYNLLQQKCTAIEKENQQSKEEFNIIITNKDKELAMKEKKIMRLTKKLEVFINSCEEDDKPLWKQVDEKENSVQMSDEPKKIRDYKMDESTNENHGNMKFLLAEGREEKKVVLKREQVAHQHVKELQMRCQRLEHALTQQSHQRSYLQAELQRLSAVVEKKHAGGEQSRESSIASVDEHMLRTGANTDAVTGGGEKNDVELLKQQLQVYAEDFNAEKDDKQKLLQENEELKKKLTLFNEEKEHLVRQLHIYEDDFHREREKRIQLMRKTGSMPDNEYPPAHAISSGVSSPPPMPQEDVQKKWKEYCCLVVEKEQISDRITELEAQGVTRYNGRHVQPAYLQYNARGQYQTTSTPTQPNLDVNMGNFYGGNVMRDATIGWSHNVYSGRNQTPVESVMRTGTSKAQEQLMHPSSPLHRAQFDPAIN